MTKRDQLARRLALVERIENPISIAAALAGSAVYVILRLVYQHIISNATWSVPIVPTFIVFKIAFTIWGARLYRQIRALDEAPALATSTATVKRVRTVPQRAEPLPEVSVAEPPPPSWTADDSTTPRYLS